MQQAALPIILLLTLSLLQAIPTSLPGQLPAISINVGKSMLTVKVYPDGSIEPIYIAEGTIYISNITVTGDMALQYNSYRMPRSFNSTGKATINLVVHGIGLWRARTLGIEVHVDKYSVVRDGVYSLQFNSTYTVRENDNKTNIGLQASLVANETKSRIRVVLNIPSHVGVIGNVGKVFRFLQELRKVLNSFVDTMSVTVSSGRERLQLVLDAVIDMVKEADYLVSNNIDKRVAYAIINYLHRLKTLNISLETISSLNFRLDAKPVGESSLSVTGYLNHMSKGRGMVEEYEKVGVEYGSAIATHLAALVLSIAAETAQKLNMTSLARNLQVALIGLTLSYTGPTLLLYTKPPSTEKLYFIAKAYGNRITFRLGYDGGRLAYLYAKGDPSLDASIALSELARSITNTRRSLMALITIMPGLVNLIPSTVLLEPASPSVKISTRRASLEDLLANRVSIEVSETSTTTTTAMTKTATTHTTTTTIAAKTTKTATETSIVSTGAVTTATSSRGETATTANTTMGRGAAGGGGYQTTLAAAIIIAAIAAVTLIYLRRR